MSDRIGIDFSSSGSVMNKKELEEQRRKRGECLTCGQKCFQKKLFKSIPITIHGQVLNGRCLKCNPLDVKSGSQVLPAMSRPATRQDLERFSRSQSHLRLNGAGMPLQRRASGMMPGSRGPSLASIGDHSNRSAASMRHIPTSSMAAPSRADESQSVRSIPNDSSRPSRANEAVSTRSAGASNRSQVINPGGRTMSGPSSRRTMTRGETGQSTRSFEGARTAPATGLFPANQPPSPLNSTTPMADVAIRETVSDSYVQGSPVPPTSRSASGTNLQSPGNGMSPNSPGNIVSDNTSPVGDSIHRAVLGSMAAHHLAERFRSRRATNATEEAAPVPTPVVAPALAHPPVVVPDRDGEMMQNVEAHGHDRIGNSSVHSHESWAADDEDFYGPQHGILNRGGVIKFEPGVSLNQGVENDHVHAPQFLSMNTESNRTMSSMSSIEEDPNSNGHHQISWKPAAEFAQKAENQDALFEDDDELSVDSNGHSTMSHTRSTRSSRSGQGRSNSVNRLFQKHEQRALDRIELAHGNYVDILAIMAELPNSALVQQEGLKDISNLHLSNSEYGHLAELGALDRVIEAMNAHPHSADVQITGCRAIWNLSATTHNQVKLVGLGGLDSILNAMAGFPDDAEVQEKAMAALSNLGAAERNQRLIMEKGTIDKIVEAMNSHSEDGAVQAKACSAITNFASYDSPLKLKIMELGGGSAVVIAMIMHPEDVDLQEKALRALRNICANSDDNKVEVANVGGIDAVISAMQVHRDEPGVQEAGAWTLSNLAVNPDNKAVIGDSGGIDVVVRAMWVHSDNVGVQEWCCRALWTLSVDAQNRQVMMEVGGISAIVNAMQAHADAATVQEKGCGVLSNLAASDDDSKIRIVEEEALDAIIMAMVLHAENKQVQDRACSVLKRLAIEPNVKSMQAANVGELVRLASQRFPDRCREKASAILAVL